MITVLCLCDILCDSGAIDERHNLLTCTTRVQVVNGLMERSDWHEAIKMPIGVLPGGSANALASSIAHGVK